MSAGLLERGRSMKIPAGDERRIALRYKSLAIAWADPGGVAPAIACRIIDISGTGAKLAHNPDAQLPDEFVLHTGHVKHYAKIVWRKTNQVGVEFEKLQRPYRQRRQAVAWTSKTPASTPSS